MSAQQFQTRLALTAEPERILLVLPTWVGDVVMATPVIRSVFGRFPNAQITLLMNHHLYPLLEGSPWLQHCCFWPPRISAGRQVQIDRNRCKIRYPASL